MSELVDGFDIASGGELDLREAGVDPARISFAGPGKRDAELEAAIAAGVTLNLESEGEATARWPSAAAAGPDPAARDPGQSRFRSQGFGDEDGRRRQAVRARCRAGSRAGPADLIASGAEWRGFHIFAGSQALDAEAIAETQAQTLELAARLAARAARRCRIATSAAVSAFPISPATRRSTSAWSAQRLDAAFGALRPELAETQFCIELGRYLVGEAGVYLTRIVDRKVSHGEVFLVTDGGLHHQLAASGNFGTVVRRNYPVAIATRFDAPVEEAGLVVGCLCTPLDRLADKAGFPRAEVGDLVAVFCAGAYGASASPAAFLGQGPAAEMLV